MTVIMIPYLLLLNTITSTVTISCKSYVAAHFVVIDAESSADIAKMTTSPSVVNNTTSSVIVTPNISQSRRLKLLLYSTCTAFSIVQAIVATIFITYKNLQQQNDNDMKIKYGDNDIKLIMLPNAL